MRDAARDSQMRSRRIRSTSNAQRVTYAISLKLYVHSDVYTALYTVVTHDCVCKLAVSLMYVTMR